MNILEEANQLTSGDRNKAYGHPRENFTHIAEMFSAYKGIEFTVDDVVAFNIITKLSREKHSHKRDNLVDIAGYARTAEMCHEDDNATTSLSTHPIGKQLLEIVTGTSNEDTPKGKGRRPHVRR